MVSYTYNVSGRKRAPSHLAQPHKVQDISSKPVSVALMVDND